jgi:hypothetical protein
MLFYLHEVLKKFMESQKTTDLSRWSKWQEETATFSNLHREEQSYCKLLVGKMNMDF